MNKRAYRKNIIKLIVIALIAIIIVAAFLFIGVKFHNHKLLRYAMKLRIPKVIDNNSICNRSGNDNISVCY